MTPLKPHFKAKKNEKWELIAFLLKNFFKKSDRKINDPGRLLEQVRYIGILF
jgi:hypothetical protein